MPQPDSSSISTFTHLRPLLAYRRHSTGLSAVTVLADPNITCPPSTLTSACVFTDSITARAPPAGERAREISTVAAPGEDAAAAARRVVAPGAAVPPGAGATRRFHHRAIAEPGVAIAGRKAARPGPPGAPALDRASLEPRRG